MPAAARHPSRYRVIAIAVASYLAGTVCFGLLYSLFPAEHFGFGAAVDPFYFASSTMSTVGYGDFAPGTTPTKLLVMLQQLLAVSGAIALATSATGTGGEG